VYLKNIDVQFVPIDRWPGQPTKNRKQSPFRSKLSDTYRLLEKELRQLGCKRLIVQCDCPANMIRQDGLPRANARMGPGVILSFDSKHGQLSYPCDTFQHWDCNIRAIALALQALRAVDRYGVTKRAEQYRGWQPLPPPASSANEFSSWQAAMWFLCQVANVKPPADGKSIDIEAVIRRAQMNTHPDKGGDPDRFKRVMAAVEKLRQP
jgi:hypothetical protein